MVGECRRGWEKGEACIAWVWIASVRMALVRLGAVKIWGEKRGMVRYGPVRRARAGAGGPRSVRFGRAVIWIGAAREMRHLYAVPPCAITSTLFGGCSR